MITRAGLISVLVLVEAAIAADMVVAVRGDQGGGAPWYAQRTGAASLSGASLVEGGPHRTFDAGPHPAVTVDIGYADLRIVADKAGQIDGSLSPSSSYGPFRATVPITIQKDGDIVRVATSRERWSMGDNRMVTLRVPRDTRVTVVRAGDIRANGLRAEASFTSVGSGSATIEDYDAPSVHVASSNGNIALRDVAAVTLDVTTSNGRIDATNLRAQNGTVESDNGRITLGFAPGTDAQVSAEADNGSVRVNGVTAAKLSDDESSSSKSVRVGAGSGRLSVHASDGNVNLLTP